MRRNVTAGADGSATALAACEWAAREAELHGASLRIVHAVAPLPGRTTVTNPTDPTPRPKTADRLGSETEDRVRSGFPDLPVVTDEVAARPVDALVDAAGDTEMLVVGSHGTGTIATLLGSVGRGVAGRAPCPVVLVPEDADGGGDVVLGLDLDRTADRAIAFACDEAAARGGALRVVHGRSARRGGPSGAAEQEGADTEEEAFAKRLAPWRAKYPGVRMMGEAALGGGARDLADAALDASLVVLDRGNHKGADQIGTVAEAVLKSSATPVAVVP
ncbi:Nucleotide-binding universal stress protein, UspA family [Actinacidiphila yanglinensis]|uniref:Nucleotide-binding universal stress protein, UspA family n=1 Tax=Actinacidiphila yanglinensis TaxID=310779 RepID=A0A1H6DQD6_9ACTN|nr:universal stress protein [Actinacidiphila yanglinensis]SEG87587.1 Nucleotide-binding universal stress protein, UspA family [Actinacidiphila yanglinensis]